MKITALLAGFILLVSASSAMAAGPYISGAGGITWVHDSEFDAPELGSPESQYDTGFGVNFAAGYRFEPMRVEFEFGYKNADVERLSLPGGSVGVDGVDLTVLSYMANVFYDFRISAPVTPYVGAGIGLLNGNYDVGGDNEDDNAFGYQLIAGVGWPLDNHLTLDLSYRFQSAPGNFEQQGVEMDYNSSNVVFGVRWNF